MVRLSMKEMVMSDCPSEKAFWFKNGITVRNIRDLLLNIIILDEFDFKYHVNSDHQKNDFADWIRDVLGDKELANELYNVTEKLKYIQIIKDRLSALEES